MLDREDAYERMDEVRVKIADAINSLYECPSMMEYVCHDQGWSELICDDLNSAIRMLGTVLAGLTTWKTAIEGREDDDEQ